MGDQAEKIRLYVSYISYEVHLH